MNSRCTPHNATGAAGAGTSSRPFRRHSSLNWRAVMARRFWPLSCLRLTGAAMSAAAWKDTLNALKGAVRQVKRNANTLRSGQAPTAGIKPGPRSTRLRPCASAHPHCLAARCGNCPGLRVGAFFLGVWHE